MIGRNVAQFHITAKLGEGGMGTVYRAEDSKLGRQVAIKVLPEEMAGDPSGWSGAAAKRRRSRRSTTPTS